jgi:anti-anti-sigma regulatory factor
MSSGLTFSTRSTPSASVVAVAGHLDAANAVEVRTVLHKAIADQPMIVVVDASELTADDIALTVFAAFARAAAAWPGCPTMLYGASPALRRRLHQMAIDRYVGIYPDEASALRASRAQPPPRRLGIRLAGTLDAPTAARDLVVRACQVWGMQRLASDAELLITELTSNAVRHGKGDLEIMVALRERFLHLSVRDESPELPHMILPDPETGEGGRGLVLVDALATGWGSMGTPSGKVVWATLRCGR